MRSCAKCDYLVPSHRLACQECGARTPAGKATSVVAVGAAGALVGIMALGLLGQTVSGNFSEIYGSSLNVVVEP